MSTIEVQQHIQMIIFGWFISDVIYVLYFRYIKPHIDSIKVSVFLEMI